MHRERFHRTGVGRGQMAHLDAVQAFGIHEIQAVHCHKVAAVVESQPVIGQLKANVLNGNGNALGRYFHLVGPAVQADFSLLDPQLRQGDLLEERSGVGGLRLRSLLGGFLGENQSGFRSPDQQASGVGLAFEEAPPAQALQSQGLHSAFELQALSRTVAERNLHVLQLQVARQEGKMQPAEIDLYAGNAGEGAAELALCHAVHNYAADGEHGRYDSKDNQDFFEGLIHYALGYLTVKQAPPRAKERE